MTYPPSWSPPGPTRRWRRRVAGALAGLVTLTVPGAGLVAPAGPVAAAPPAGAESPAAAGSGLSPATTHEVTLVTGDRVELTVHGPDGPYETEVFPAQRPGTQAPMFLTQVGPAGVYVVPSDVAAAVESGQVDRELFNVSGLAEQGYADDAADALPVIVSYPPPVGAASRGWAPPAAADLAARADQLPATTGAVGLTSLNGAGVRVAKQQAAEFWQQLRGGSGPAAAGVPRVWLDGTAEVVLDESVPLIGAPDAWDAGYDGTGTTVAVLDTGVDLDHPDLAGRVSVAESFVDGLPPQDGQGHGTHVAATIAGSGAGAGGQFTGVAPGADLISGKVCNDKGQCPHSAMIAGMEWAASEMGADIVSMSIGGEPTDGTDPLSQAVNSLTASSGALFVIAAGNLGGEVTVSSPGAADAALTVAATDKSDGLASFSSRGPRHGDLALKPDIAAPGVGIVAARAAGTSLGTPVDELYTSLNGTSMATPHVSGAAAILAQRHPDWEPGRLKAALMSTAVDAGHTVYQQGAGRLDVARAAGQPVHAATANLDFGIVAMPPAGEPEPAPVTEQVSYTNQSDQPVTLTLTPSLATTGGDPVPAGALTTDPSVTVPAGGQATVDVVLDVTGLDRGYYSGAVVATDDATGTRVTTPVGLVREPPRVTLTIRTLGRDGQPAATGGTQIIDVSGPDGFITDLNPLGEGVTSARVPNGVYSVAQVVSWVDEESRLNGAWLLQPELTVDGDTELVLDARDATQVTFDTPQPSEPLNNDAMSSYQRTTADGGRLGGQLTTKMDNTGSWMRLWVTPTAQVTVGQFRFVHQWVLGEGGTEMTVLDREGPALHPATPLTTWSPQGLQTISLFPAAEQFRGTTELPVVDAGSATPADLAGKDLTGKLALLQAGLIEQLFGPVCGLDINRIEAVQEAGAVGVVAYPVDDRCPIPLQIGQPLGEPRRAIGIRYTFLPSAEGLALSELLADGPARLRVVGAPAESPYLNVLKPYEEGRVPDSLHYRFTERDLMVTDLDFHAPELVALDGFHQLYKQDDLLIRSMSSTWSGGGFLAPRTLREYVGPIDADVLHWRGSSTFATEGFGYLSGSQLANRQSLPEPLSQAGHSREQWFTAPLTPGPAVASDAAYAATDPAGRGLRGLSCTLCREGNLLVGISYQVTGPPDAMQHDNNAGARDAEYRLYRDGQEIAPKPILHVPGFELPEEPGTYRLEHEAGQTETAWTFTSGPPTAEAAHPLYFGCMARFFGLNDDLCAPVPAVYVSYDLRGQLAMDNTVPAPGVQRFDVFAYHHPSPLPMPEIAGLKLWASYDGEQWEPVPVRATGDGRFQARLLHPPADARGSDQVSLKVEAWDVDGNRVEQITRDAFGLRDRAPAAPGGAH